MDYGIHKEGAILEYRDEQSARTLVNLEMAEIVSDEHNGTSLRQIMQPMLRREKLQLRTK